MPRTLLGRRWPTLVFFVTVLFVFLESRHGPAFWNIAAPGNLAAVGACPRTPPSQPYTLPSNDGFSWRTIRTKYPVQSLRQLPRGQPPSLPRVQAHFKPAPQRAEMIRKQRQAAVKKTFQRGWNSYEKHAWKKDELAPLSGDFKSTFGGWGATLVDNLDTLLIMGLNEEFERAVSAVMDTDFRPESSSQHQLNIFEITIRYLGGFISAYDLTGCKDQRLLNAAVKLGDMIYASFDTPNRMPVTRWSPHEAAAGEEQFAADNGIIAEMSSSSLEFIRLSQLTGDMRWFDAVSRIADVMDEQQSRTNLPGIWPVGINVQKPDLTRGSVFSFGAMADSAYEYLGKTYQLLGGVGPIAAQFQKLYTHAMETGMQYLLFRPKLPDNADVLMASNVRALRNRPGFTPQRESTSEQLACFAGGMFALGGRLFNNDSHLDVGRKLTDGCVWVYRHSPIGIMPERFTLTPCDSSEEGACRWDEEADGEEFFAAVNDKSFSLRPEAVESIFYMYRITGDPRLQDAAWEMFEAIEKNTRTEFANAKLKDVTRKNPTKEDSMESFWMGETLKYFYLIFSEPELISLDDFVLNTEAHPFRLPR